MADLISFAFMAFQLIDLCAMPNGKIEKCYNVHYSTSERPPYYYYMIPHDHVGIGIDSNPYAELYYQKGYVKKNIEKVVVKYVDGAGHMQNTACPFSFREDMAIIDSSCVPGNRRWIGVTLYVTKPPVPIE